MAAKDPDRGVANLLARPLQGRDADSSPPPAPAKNTAALQKLSALPRTHFNEDGAHPLSKSNMDLHQKHVAHLAHEAHIKEEGKNHA